MTRDTLRVLLESESTLSRVKISEIVGAMTAFDDWLEKDGVGSDAIELKLRRAWDAANADCQAEIARLEVKTQRAFDAWVEEKLKTEKATLAIAEIADIFTSETDPTRACHRIQAIVNRHGDPNETDKDMGRGK